MAKQVPEQTVTSEEIVREAANIIWHRFVAIPIEGAYRSEYEFLLETLNRLERAAWTLGTRTH